MAESKPQPWEVLASQITFRDRWLTLRTDRCRTPTGFVLEAYHVVEFSDWLNVLAITTDFEVITLREYRHGAGQVVRGLPAGMIEREDPSPLEAARRELSEETGYGGGEIFSLGAAFANPAVQNNRVHSFLATDLIRIGETHLDPSENIEVHREPFASFARKAFRRELEFQCIHLAGVHDALMFILSRGNQAEASLTLRRLRDLALEEMGAL